MLAAVTFRVWFSGICAGLFATVAAAESPKPHVAGSGSEHSYVKARSRDRNDTPAENLVVTFVNEVWNGNRPDRLGKFLAADYSVRSPGIPDPIHDPGWMRQQLQRSRELLPDLRVDIVELIGEEDRVALRWRAKGTLAGRGAGVRGLGREIEVAGAAIVRTDRDRIVEIWYLQDHTGFPGEFRPICVPSDPWAVTPGCIGGRAFDGDAGSPLGLVRVDIAGVRADVERLARGDGRFTFCDIAPGSYRVSASTPGYEPVHLDDVRVCAGETTSVELRLNRGRCSTTPVRWPQTSRAREKAALAHLDSILACLWDADADSCSRLYLAGDCLIQSPGKSAVIGGQDEAKRQLGRLRSVLPDARVVFHEALSDDDLLVTRWGLAGTLRGAFAGIEAGGRNIRIEGITFANTHAHLILGEWSLYDHAGWMRQLGFTWTCAAGVTAKLPSTVR